MYLAVYTLQVTAPQWHIGEAGGFTISRLYCGRQASPGVCEVTPPDSQLSSVTEFYELEVDFSQLLPVRLVSICGVDNTGLNELNVCTRFNDSPQRSFSSGHH